VIRFSSENSGGPATSTQPVQEVSTSKPDVDLEKDISKFARQTAATFAPRSSTAKKNPATKGSLLYDVFEYQAWIAMAVGGLLSFNIIYPTEQPDIPRLLGMWSIWMFTIPSLRAKECMPREKDALNLLFVAVPLMNVILPFVWKSFPFIFVTNVLAVFGTYAWKGVWREVYGLPIGAEPVVDPPAPQEGQESEPMQQ